MLSPIPEILDELRAGRMIVLVDDERRENEGDLVLPAQFVTPPAITFMLSVARGYLCVALTESDCDRLDLPPMAGVNTSVRQTAFTVSVDGHPRHGFTTGVSAAERARCIRMLIDPASGAGDFVRPGHINPLRSRNGGVLVRTGQTEGSVDLCRLAGLYPAACIIEIMRDDGEMARVPDLERLCAAHHLKMCSVAQIIQHRLERDSIVRRLEPAAGAEIRTPEGRFTLFAYESVVDPLPQIALTVGGVGRLDAAGQVQPTPEPTLVRMHRRNLLGDVFGDLGAGGGDASGLLLRNSMRAIQRAGRGAIVYLRPEGVGDGLEERLQAIRRSRGPAGSKDRDENDLADASSLAASAVPPHMRDFGVGVQILRDLGLARLMLLTNRTTDLPGLEAFGLSIAQRVKIPET